MALFNQLMLHNILERRNNLGTPELRAAIVSMTEEQKDDTLVFLKCNTEELAGLPNGQGMQAVANVCTLLDCLPTIEPDTGSIQLGAAHKSADREASSLLLKFDNF